MDERAHAEPETWCQAPLCPDTNWGGYNRLHRRGSHCPPYNPDPPPNPMAELWEAVRLVARENAQASEAEQASRPPPPLRYADNPVLPPAPQPAEQPQRWPRKASPWA